MYIVSACLLGENCKYSGGSNYARSVEDFLKDKEYIKVCPEVSGGLNTPRPPSEIIGIGGGASVLKGDSRVIDKEGRDVSSYFAEGACKCYNDIFKQTENVVMAILKARSPSCGQGEIYDGTFTGKTIKGDGVFTAFLKEKGIEVITDEDL